MCSGSCKLCRQDFEGSNKEAGKVSLKLDGDLKKRLGKRQEARICQGRLG